jgi:hypothetical protein
VPSRRGVRHNGPEAVTSRRAKPYIDTRRVKPNPGTGTTPALRSWSVARAVQAVGWRSTTRLLIGIFRARSCDILTTPALQWRGPVPSPTYGAICNRVYSDGGTVGWFITTLTSSEFLSAAIRRPCLRRLSVWRAATNAVFPRMVSPSPVPAPHEGAHLRDYLKSSSASSNWTEFISIVSSNNLVNT